MTVGQRLEALADESNAGFLSRLLPGIEPETVLGVRMRTAISTRTTCTRC